MSESAPLRSAHAIDTMWCDAFGVYVVGWAHAYSSPVMRLSLRCGEHECAIVNFRDRPDVLAHYPMVPTQTCGFATYLACPPFLPVSIVVTTTHGSVAMEIARPPHLESPASQADAAAPLDDFILEMKKSGGTVVEIGSRVVGPASNLLATRFAPECRHVGVDIHSAPGVDIVGDAHALTDLVGTGTASGVFSLAVLEHIAAPWLVAAQINRALRPGGLTFHLVPQTFPVHEMPNDFWRMSDEGLKVLFGPATGFEVVLAAMANPVSIYMQPECRRPPFLEMPLNPGMSAAFIISRKVNELAPDAVTWPTASAAMAAHSHSYPSHKRDI